MYIVYYTPLPLGVSQYSPQTISFRDQRNPLKMPLYPPPILRNSHLVNVQGRKPLKYDSTTRHYTEHSDTLQYYTILPRDHALLSMAYALLTAITAEAGSYFTSPSLLCRLGREPELIHMSSWTTLSVGRLHASWRITSPYLAGSEGQSAGCSILTKAAGHSQGYEQARLTKYKLLTQGLSRYSAALRSCSPSFREMRMDGVVMPAPLPSSPRMMLERSSAFQWLRQVLCLMAITMLLYIAM